MDSNQERWSSQTVPSYGRWKWHSGKFLSTKWNPTLWWKYSSLFVNALTFISQEYSSPADGKVVNLEKPLLSHAWSAAFSFAKCHIEETAPYDPFIPYVFGVEQFSRFARFWTRGYDVYTPTKNFIYHDYSSNGHDIKEWFRQRRERLRNESLHRVHTMLQIPGGDSSETAQANLGVYGLGRRRTIQQLMDFVGIDLVKKTGNRGVSDSFYLWRLNLTFINCRFAIYSISIARTRHGSLTMLRPLPWPICLRGRRTWIPSRSSLSAINWCFTSKWTNKGKCTKSSSLQNKRRPWLPSSILLCLVTLRLPLFSFCGSLDWLFGALILSTSEEMVSPTRRQERRKVGLKMSSYRCCKSRNVFVTECNLWSWDKAKDCNCNRVSD